MPQQRLPLIGQNIEAPPLEAVMRAALQQAQLDVAIEHWDRKPHQLADAVSALKGRDYMGALVLAPHKEKVATLVTTLSEDARITGAVSLLVRDGQRLRGHNTDVDGARHALAGLLPKVQGKWPRHAVVLGGGAAARAVVSVLVTSGFQRVAVFNRHLHRAESLVAHFARTARHMDLRAMPWHDTIIEAELSRAGLLVNATAISTLDGETIVPPDVLPPSLFLLDLVLGQKVTPLMREVQERGGSASNGQASFLRSSAVAFQLLTGGEASADTMRDALAAAVDAPADGIAPVAGD